MSKKQLAVLLVAVLLLASCSRPQISSDPSPASEALESSRAAEIADDEAAAPKPAGHPMEELAPSAQPLLPSQENMMETIQALCTAPRPIGSTEEYEAALLLRGLLEEYGYISELEPFSYNITRNTLMDRYWQVRELTGEAFFSAALPGESNDGDSQNVIGRQAWEPEKDWILVLSAHYDSTPDSLGVIDNAAGVAVVLEAAHILAHANLPFSLRVVFFGGEEEILIGSRLHLLAMEEEEIGRILGNINVDTLAYTQREEFAALTPLALTQKDAAALAQASPVAAALLTDSRVTPEFSSTFVGDHMAFSAAGIDSVNFGQSMNGVSGIINSPQDTYAQLVPELLPIAAQLLVDAVLELAEQVQ